MTLQAQLKESHRDLDDLCQSRDELLITARESEKKANNIEADLMQAQEDLSASERHKKAAEAERDELQEELAGGLKDKYGVTYFYLCNEITNSTETLRFWWKVLVMEEFETVVVF